MVPVDGSVVPPVDGSVVPPVDGSVVPLAGSGVPAGGLVACLAGF